MFVFEICYCMHIEHCSMNLVWMLMLDKLALALPQRFGSDVAGHLGCAIDVLTRLLSNSS